jgi:hypothetical protein
MLYTPGQWMGQYADSFVSWGFSVKWHSRDIIYGISVGELDVDKERAHWRAVNEM